MAMFRVRRRKGQPPRPRPTSLAGALLRSLLVAVLLNVSPAPSMASTMPALDFEQGQTVAAVGLSDINLDHGMLEWLSFGLTAIPRLETRAFLPYPHQLLSPGIVAGRVGVRLVSWEGLRLGLCLSGGATWVPDFLYMPWGDQGPPEAYWPWVQPAVVISYRMPMAWLPLTLGFSWGPVTYYDGRANTYEVGQPNLEASYRLVPSHELTLGGNSIIGWRGYFGGSSQHSPSEATWPENLSAPQAPPNPQLAALLSAGAPIALWYGASFVSAEGSLLRPAVSLAGFGAGQVYAGDPVRGAFVSLGGPALVLGSLYLYGLSHGGDVDPGGNLGILVGNLLILGLTTVGYATFAATDAYLIAQRQARCPSTWRPPFLVP